MAMALRDKQRVIYTSPLKACIGHGGTVLRAAHSERHVGTQGDHGDNQGRPTRA